MRAVFLKIVILLVSCCFIAAATETDIGDYHQTFFDDYDTYLPNNQRDVQVAPAHESPCNDFALLVPASLAIAHPDILTFLSFNKGPGHHLNYPRHLLFLHHCALLI